MTNKSYGIGVAIIVVAILGATIYLSMQPASAPATNTTPVTNVVTNTTPVTNTAPPTNTTPVPPPPVPTPPTTKASVYETPNLKVNIPAGWTATEAAQATYVGTSTTPTYSPNPAAVNITNGNWILYVNVDASQASGVDGGRFAEIGMGAPSVDAIVTDEPNECGKTSTVSAYSTFSRVDYTMNTADVTPGCVAPTNGKTVWFFSYMTSPGNGFFNDYTVGSNPGLVVTMAYNSKDVNNFPVKGSAELSAALKTMTDIASSIVVKIK